MTDTPDLRTIGGPCCAHIRVTYRPIEVDASHHFDRWTCDDCSTEFQPVAARSPAPCPRMGACFSDNCTCHPRAAPSDAIRHPGNWLVRVEKPGGLRFDECSAPTLEEAAEGVGNCRTSLTRPTPKPTKPAAPLNQGRHEPTTS